MLSVGIVGLLSQTVNANRDTAIFVQMKTRDTPCQMYSGAISTIPKVTTLVTSQPTLHSTRIKIDGTAVFQFGHFHSLQNGNTVLTSSGQMFLL